MVVDCIELLVAKHEGGETTEENWLGIQLLNLEGGCWIATVAAGQSSWKNTVQSSSVSGDSCEDSCHRARVN